MRSDVNVFALQKNTFRCFIEYVPNTPRIEISWFACNTLATSIVGNDWRDIEVERSAGFRPRPVRSGHGAVKFEERQICTSQKKKKICSILLKIFVYRVYQNTVQVYNICSYNISYHYTNNLYYGYKTHYHACNWWDRYEKSSS